MVMWIRILCCGALLLSCGTSDEVDCSSLANPDIGLELVYPRGGETLTLGRFAAVEWKADPGKMSSVVLAVSINGSTGPWRNILSREMTVPGGGAVVCMDTVWVPGDEYDAVGYSAGTTVLLRVCSSTDERYCDESGMISIER